MLRPTPCPANDRQPCSLGDLLNRARYVAHAVAGEALRDPGMQRFLGRVEQVARLAAHLPDRKRSRRVGDPAVERHADVDRHDVTVLQPVGARDAVHDHRVGRRTNRAGEAAVSLEGGRSAAGADVALGDLVQLGRAYARADLALQQLKRGDEDLAGTRHALDLLG
jgi:hypothetical protein